MYRRTILQLVLLLLIWPTTPSITMADDGDSWSLRTRNRKQLIIRRLRLILRRNPFSPYALRRLLSVYKSPKELSELEERLRESLTQAPSDLPNRILLARLLEANNEWAEAQKHYMKVHKQKPKWVEPMLALGRCLFARKKHKKAISFFRKGLADLKGYRKRRILWKLLRSSLKAKQRKVIAFSLKQIEARPLMSDEKLTLARMLVEHEQWKPGLRLYDTVLKTSDGAFRVRLLLEMCRARIAAKEYTKALAHIKEARSIKSIHKWFLWELQVREVEIYRNQKRLSSLLSKLRTKWSKAPHNKDYRKVLLLAQLFQEVKLEQSARQYFERASALKPTESEPRLQLIKWYFNHLQPEKAFAQIKQLIKFDVASPIHYLQLAKYNFKKSMLHNLSPWEPEWAEHRTCKQEETTQTTKQSLEKVTCKRKDWNVHRQRMWRFWRRYIATQTQKKAYDRAISLLALLKKRYQGNWQVMLDLQEMYNRYGRLKESEQAFQHMVKATQVDVKQIRTVQVLLWKKGRTDAFRKVLIGLLHKSVPTFRNAVEFASYVYNPTALPDPAPEPTLEEVRAWQKKIHLPLRLFLYKIQRRLPESFVKSHPELSVRMNVLRYQCGDKSPKVRSAIKRAEERLIETTPGVKFLLSLYLEYQYDEALGRLLTHPRFKKYPQQLHALLYPLIDKKISIGQVQFLLNTTFTSTQKRNPLFISLLTKACRQKRLCVRLQPYFEKAINTTSIPPQMLMQGLQQAMRFKPYKSKSTKWLASLKKNYWEHPASLHKLVESSALFKSSKEMQNLHLSILIRALQKRKTQPFKLGAWGRMIQEHLKRLRPRRFKDKQMILKLEQATKRFPMLYRQILAFYLYNYKYRKKYGIPRLKVWLLSNPQVDDLMFLERYYYYINRSQGDWLADLVKQMKTSSQLHWMATFAHKKGKLKLHIQVLKRLIQLHPKSSRYLKRIVELMDRSKQSRQADAYAIRWLKMHPEVTTISSIRSFAKGCCADLSSQHRARRLLFVGLKQHGFKSLWPSFEQLYPQLQRKQQDALVKLILQQKHSKQQLLKLDELLQKGPAIAAHGEVLKRLLATGSHSRQHQRKYATLLERKGEPIKATAYWEKYLKGMSADKRVRFFKQRAKRFVRAGDFRLAGLAYYRALAVDPPDNSEEIKEQIEEISRKEPWKAWGMWLWMLGKKNAQCLQNNKKHFPHRAFLATPLMKLGILYRGPYVQFARCQWLLPQRVRYTAVTTLIQHLKNYPMQKIVITGRANKGSEPDEAFLAKMRASSLRQAIINAGIAKNRVKVEYFDNSTKPCASLTKQKEKSLCHLSLQRVSISFRSPYMTQASTTQNPVSFSKMMNSDADNDGVPDYMDNCPLVSIEKATRYQYKRRYRRTKKKTQLKHPLTKLYPNNHSYRSYRRYNRGSTAGPLSKTLLRGCPLTAVHKQIKGLQADILQTENIPYYRNSTSIRSYGYAVINQVAALLRLMPSLGKVQIEVKVKDERYKRYRKRRLRYYQKPKYIAKKRAQYLIRYLKRQGIPSSRLSYVLVTKPEKKRPRVIFRLLDIKTKMSPFPDPKKVGL